MYYSTSAGRQAVAAIGKAPRRMINQADDASDNKISQHLKDVEISGRLLGEVVYFLKVPSNKY